MNKLLGLFFAAAMILGVAFVSDSFNVSAQRGGNVTVKKKNRSLASTSQDCSAVTQIVLAMTASP